MGKGQPAADLIGKKFNMLTVISRAKRPKGTRDTAAWWLVKCDCGKEKILRGNSFTRRIRRNKVAYNTKSCGCSTSKLMSESRKLEFGLSQKRTVYKYYLTHAKKLNKPFKLKFDDFIELVEKNCFYCDSKPKNIAKSNNNNGDFIYNGIDRKDNNLGYTKENSVPCCKICNIAKNKQSIEEFYKWINSVWQKITFGTSR